MLKIFILFLFCILSTTVTAHGMSAEDQARILNAGYLEYMELGASHMLTGYDHLLFLFGVIFFLTRYKDILLFITAFTVGHSLTLVFATLLSINANYYLIDAVIALTVCYKAFDNLEGFQKYFQMASPNLAWMVFIFGLIHGFGLSTRLQQLPLGDQNIVLKILSFNLGVELGQIIALSLMLLVLTGWRKTTSFQRFSKVANVSLIVVGALLFLMQLHSYQHTQFPDNYPLNKDDHHHVHEAMKQQASPLSHYPHKLNLNLQPSKQHVPQPQGTEPNTHSHDGEEYHSH